MWRLVALVVALGTTVSGCGSTNRPQASSPPPAVEDDSVRFRPHEGPRRRVQVVEIGIPAKELDRYPELREKRVGLGLSSILVETLFDTGRFDLIEGQEKIIERHAKLWQLREDGFYLKDHPFEGLIAPEFLVYAKIFDFVACSPEERINPAGKQLTCVTSVGVQVRIENRAGQFVPGTTSPLSKEGSYAHTKDLSFFGSPEMAFDQSAVGKATWKATRHAVLRAAERLDRQGW